MPFSFSSVARRVNRAKSYRDHAACMFGERHKKLLRALKLLFMPSEEEAEGDAVVVICSGSGPLALSLSGQHWQVLKRPFGSWVFRAITRFSCKTEFASFADS